jgi:hypothetical protein
MTTPKRSNGFYYFISNNPGFLICDPECCSESNDTFDIYFNSLATNETLLHYFRLVAMYANKGIEGARWFANYLSAFSKNNDNQYEKLRYKCGEIIEKIMISPNMFTDFSQFSGFASLFWRISRFSHREFP